MRALLLSLVTLLLTALPSLAQQSLADILSANRDQIEKPSRQTIGPVIDALAKSGDPAASAVLEAWQDKRLGLRDSDGAFFIVEKTADGWALTAPDGTPAGTAPKGDIKELKPNAGVRGLIATALVQFTLSDPDRAKRAAALESIAKDPKAEALPPLRTAIDSETDADLKAQKERLERLLTLRFDPDSAARVAAIKGFGADLGIDLRAALNPLLATTRIAYAGDLPAGTNLARALIPGTDLSETAAYDLLVAAGQAPARLTVEDARNAPPPPPMPRWRPPSPPTALPRSMPNPTPP